MTLHRMLKNMGIYTLLCGLNIGSLAANASSPDIDTSTQRLLNRSIDSNWLAVREQRDRLLLYDRVSSHSFERRVRRRGPPPQRIREDRGYGYYTYPSYRLPDEEPCEDCQRGDNEY